MKLLAWREEEEPVAARQGDPLETARERRGRPLSSSPLAEAAEELWRWNEERGAASGLRDRWMGLADGRTLAVITGQQPALLGGPLYSLYKLLTAIRLASAVEKKTGAPCLAVFWVVGDDSDFGEVSWTFLPGRDGRLHRLREEKAPPGGTLIGRLPARDQIDLLRREENLLAEVAGGERLGPLVADAARRAGDWSGLMAALLFRLLPGLPFAVLDGGHPRLIQAQGEWLRRTSALPLEALLQEGEEAARSAGFAPALDPSLGSRALFRIEEGRRAPLAGVPAGPDALAPNVVLRPLLQDALFRNAATVCGPSEIRYRAQLLPVYREAGIPVPALVPRMRGVLLPPLAEVKVDSEALARSTADPESFLAGLAERELPREVLAETEQARVSIRHALDGLRPGLTSFDASLIQLLDSAAGKIDFQAGRILEGIRGKARGRLYRRDPVLAQWGEFVRPRGEEQERALSLLTPFLLEPDAAPVLAAAADAHLERILAGGPDQAAVFLLENMGRSMSDQEVRDE